MAVIGKQAERERDRLARRGVAVVDEEIASDHTGKLICRCAGREAHRLTIAHSSDGRGAVIRPPGSDQGPRFGDVVGGEAAAFRFGPHRCGPSEPHGVGNEWRAAASAHGKPGRWRGARAGRYLVEGAASSFPVDEFDIVLACGQGNHTTRIGIAGAVVEEHG